MRQLPKNLQLYGFRTKAVYKTSIDLIYYYEEITFFDLYRRIHVSKALR